LPVSVSVFGVPNTGIPVSVYTGLETLAQTVHNGLVKLLYRQTLLKPKVIYG
jgi:hypothetical protein